MATFLIASAGVTVTGTTDKDTFEVVPTASSITVMGLDGDDTVKVSASNFSDSIAKLGGDDDSFSQESTGDILSSTILGGAGDDTIEFGFGTADIKGVTVRGNEGKDTISLTLTGLGDTASSLSIQGNTEDDTITITSDENIMDAGIGGGQDDDEITIVNGSIQSSIIAGGFGQDELDLDLTILSSLVRGGNGTDDATDSADTIEISGLVQNSTVKAGAGDDTISASLLNDSTSSIFEGNAGEDTIIVTGVTDYEGLEIRGGADDDTLTLDGAAVGVDVSAEVIGGAGDDTIDTVNATGAVLIGGAGADDFTWVDGGQTYEIDAVTDSTADGLDQISAGAAVDTDVVETVFDGFDLNLQTASTVSATFDGVSATLTFSADGKIDFSLEADINDLTAAAGFLSDALSTNEVAVFTFSGQAMVTGTDVFLFVEGGDNDTVIEMTDLGTSGVATFSGANYVPTLTDAFGQTTVTVTV